MSERALMESAHVAASTSSSSDASILGLQRHHQQDLENLTLRGQPCKTLKLFGLAVVQYVKQSILYVQAKGGFLVILSILAAALGLLFVMVDGSRGKHVEEISKYIQFGLWWLALGVASSIGLGSGLHTFVLYLGPHIALFTIKAMQCGRVDLKRAPYDTIQFKRCPSWLNKDCSEFGLPLFTSSSGLRVPLSSILPQVQVEAILWGIGTALGELPPYFISRAARLSGSNIDAMEEFDVSSSKESGVIANHLAQIKCWLLSHSQHLNFTTILVLASVPNPLFDLAGIMCGQLGIPFWKFLFATLLGKAIIKTHIQTILIISVCNNQLLNYMENLIMLLSFIPGVASILPSIMSRLNAARERYLTAPPVVTSNIKAKKWDLSFASIWNTVVWLVLMNFFSKIVTATAQNYLKNQQEKELHKLTESEYSPIDSNQEPNHALPQNSDAQATHSQ